MHCKVKTKDAYVQALRRVLTNINCFEPKKNKADSKGEPAVRCVKAKNPLLSAEVVGHGEMETAFGAAASENFTAVGCGHSFAEAVLVNSFTVRGLECSFHCLM